ncbi:HNH endonuclease [Gordonia sihwensis]|uniref:HNH endonuclease n=1 Tax=Gordonia sihwensis TaxID=173559 RepID=UPI0012DFF894|nr:HNH endonuclease [Gordonia sihwensis]
MKIRDDVRTGATSRKVNIDATRGVIAEKVDRQWLPLYYAVEGTSSGEAKPMTGRPPQTYAAARQNNSWSNPDHSPDFSADDCPRVTVDLDADAAESERESAIAFGDEIERRYAERVVRQRLHQPELRRMTLDHHGTACAYCGLDVPQIVEAAHLVADSEGGEASIQNTRPMCPNHHRAFDAGLLVWDGKRFERADGAPPVGPAPREA